MLRVKIDDLSSSQNTLIAMQNSSLVNAHRTPHRYHHEWLIFAGGLLLMDLDFEGSSWSLFLDSRMTHWPVLNDAGALQLVIL